jgi:S-adenosylmethionine:tRNA ribosyltransferase-isomerase
MHISDFEYDLPRELIAQHPLPERDASRLLVVDRARGTIEHRDFADLTSLLESGDRLVVNDTRVIPARLLGTRPGGTAETEVLLLSPVQGRPGRPTFQALCRPARKMPAGSTVRLGRSEVEVTILQELSDRARLVEFPENFPIMRFLEQEGHVPLPPYIQRSDEPEDRERYQTIFAQKPGAVAAPTAGLHFTPAVVDTLRKRGVDTTSITLHVGAGTFTPVVEQDPRLHRMEREYYRIPPEAAEAVGRTHRAGRRVVAVGTTVVRALETAELHDPEAGLWTVRPGDGWTEKFIYPPYEFHVVDAMVTNFHLPRSTLLMMVSAFGGLELIRRAYREAVNREYRFYSYGDAMMIL